jgi:hypothetical protein
MGSRYPPGFYDEDTLKAVEGAFRDVWKASRQATRARTQSAMASELRSFTGFWN